MPFEFIPTDLPDVILVQPRRFPDDRGYFLETYKRSEFFAARIDADFVQDNHSRSSRGTIRGLHYQLPPHAQGKLVRVVRGAVLDVAVDIRRSSPSFGRWVTAELSEQNGLMLWIPPGFAHGFLALEDDTHLSYKCTSEYNAGAEAGIRFDDIQLNIPWPEADYLISPRDAALPSLTGAEVFL